MVTRVEQLNARTNVMSIHRWSSAQPTMSRTFASGAGTVVAPGPARGRAGGSLGRGCEKTGWVLVSAARIDLVVPSELVPGLVIPPLAITDGTADPEWVEVPMSRWRFR